MHTIKCKTSGNDYFFALKLDMNKTNDRVEGSFLLSMMQQMDFDNKWIGLILRCISLVSYSILINKNVCYSITPKRSLKQSDHLSPYFSYVLKIFLAY